MTNDQLGRMWEKQLSEMLYRDGFWVHIFKGNQNGQPSDIIAVKDGHAYLIDAKVCSVKGFALSRIESNQRTAMNLWRQRGNHEPMFGLLIPGGHAYMVPLATLEDYEERGHSFMNVQTIQYLGIDYDTWRTKCKLS